LPSRHDVGRYVYNTRMQCTLHAHARPPRLVAGPCHMTPGRPVASTSALACSWSRGFINFPEANWRSDAPPTGGFWRVGCHRPAKLLSAEFFPPPPAPSRSSCSLPKGIATFLCAGVFVYIGLAGLGFLYFFFDCLTLRLQAVFYCLTLRLQVVASELTH
jgi:hypothetical protein